MNEIKTRGSPGTRGKKNKILGVPGIEEIKIT